MISCSVCGCLGIWVSQRNIAIWALWLPSLVFPLAETKHSLCVLGLMDFSCLCTLRKSSSKRRIMIYWLWDNTEILVCEIINIPNIYWLQMLYVNDNCLILSLSWELQWKATLDLIACAFLSRLSLDFAVLMFLFAFAYPVNGHSPSYNQSLKMSMSIGLMKDPNTNKHIFMPTLFISSQKWAEVLRPVSRTWQAGPHCTSELKASLWVIPPNSDAELFWQNTRESGTDTEKDKSSVLLMTFQL